MNWTASLWVASGINAWQQSAVYATFSHCGTPGFRLRMFVARAQQRIIFMTCSEPPGYHNGEKRIVSHHTFDKA
jgi:hypothetical protein